MCQSESSRNREKRLDDIFNLKIMLLGLDVVQDIEVVGKSEGKGHILFAVG